MKLPFKFKTTFSISTKNNINAMKALYENGYKVTGKDTFEQFSSSFSILNIEGIEVVDRTIFLYRNEDIIAFNKSDFKEIDINLFIHEYLHGEIGQIYLLKNNLDNIDFENIDKDTMLEIKNLNKLLNKKQSQ